MKVIVDTCIWSVALRHQSKPTPAGPIIKELKELILVSRVQMLGAIRQELLSGISLPEQFKKLRTYLAAFPDLTMQIGDYEIAAEFYNAARAKGIQGSHSDFLICAISFNYRMPIFTVDKDFNLFAKVLPIKLHTY